MHLEWSTFALQTVNFAVLLWLLHRFLYKPVLRMVDRRRAEIDNQYAEAGRAEAQAKDRLKALEAEHAGIAAERTAALKEAAAEADRAGAARRARAEREAAAFLADARKTLAVERRRALVEARQAALDLGAEIAGRLLAEIPVKLRAEAWIERIEQYLAGLAPSERGALLQEFDDRAPLQVVTASKLPAEAEEAWRSRINRQLCHHLSIDFGVDPELVAGAELHLPNAVLRFSWRSTLAAIRAGIEVDGDAA
jgi:F-type H+-transporting ATPase subunit b